MEKPEVGEGMEEAAAAVVGELVELGYPERIVVESILEAAPDRMVIVQWLLRKCVSFCALSRPK